MNGDLNTDEKPDRSAAGTILAWSLRAAVGCFVIWLFRYADQGLVEHWANATSIIVPIVTFYFLTFEPKAVAWVIERIRIILNRRTMVREQGKTAKAPAEVSDNQHVRTPSPPRSSTATSHAIDAESKPDAHDGLDEAPKHREVPLLGLISLLYIFAGLLGHTYQPGTKTDGRFTPEDAIPAEAEPELPPSIDNEPSRPPAEDTTVPTIFAVKPGDSCYAIALACTGDGERFTELGPPTNPALDVSDRDFCLIRPGEALNLPDAWPKDCAQ